MLAISRDSLSIQHIMWQPIFECVQGCQGCYVAASSSAAYKGRFVSEIVDLIYSYEAVSCQQFTISLDTLKAPHEELVTTLKWLWWFYSQSKDCGCENITRRSLNDKQLPELCITVRNWQTLRQWAGWMGMKVSEFLQPLTLVSLSRFPVKRTTCEEMKALTKKTKTVLNYNRLAEPVRRKAEFSNGVEFADQVYVVYKKNPLDFSQSEEAVLELENMTAQAVAMRGDFRGISVDKCIRDSSKYNKTGLTCDAAIHKVHVWPDGSVTGCPYDSKHRAVPRICLRSLTHHHSTWEELQAAVVSRKCHPMKLCKIPEVLKQLQKRHEDEVEQEVQQR